MEGISAKLTREYGLANSQLNRLDLCPLSVGGIGRLDAGRIATLRNQCYTIKQAGFSRGRPYYAGHQSYRNTQFCEYFSRYLSQQYKGGEKLFVDWSGDTTAYLDGPEGGIHEELGSDLHILQMKGLGNFDPPDAMISYS
jgi:hypothetical protein